MRAVVFSLVVLGCRETILPDPIATPPDCTIGFADRDGDGFGGGLQTSSCQEPVVDNDDDCDDLTRAVNPNAVEVCDEIDNDCDGLVDLDDPNVLGAAQYIDDDDDGFGTGEPVSLCETLEGYVDRDGDCDDTDDQIRPDATEVCDGIDNDCDDAIDDDDTSLDRSTATTWFDDLDGDGFGSTPIATCDQPPDTVSLDGDCDDSEPSTFPGAVERCNNQDSDCDGALDATGAEPDPCLPFEASYTGSYTLTAVNGLVTRTCAGTADVTVDRGQIATVLGTFSCTFDMPAGGFATTQTGAIEGWLNRDGIAAGSVEALEGLPRDWTGGTNGAAFTMDASGLQVDTTTSEGWNLTMTVDLDVANP
jgi:hypothetical protein